MGEVVEKLKSYPLSRDIETKEVTGYRYIHYGDIHKQIADLIEEDEQLPSIKVGNYNSLDCGDLILADASEDYTGIAEPCVILHKPKDKIIAGLHTIAIRPQKATPLYLYYLLHTDKFKKFGNRTGSGLKVFGITFNNLSLFNTNFPNIAEQTTIGNFFRTFDDTITLHQRKLDNLKTLKHGYLQQMFPQTDENVPRIRFAGFTAPWQVKKLGEIIKVNSGRDYKHLNEGLIPVYGTGGYMLSVDESLSDIDAIGIGRKGTINKPQLLSAPFWTVDTLFFITPRQDNNLLYLYALSQNIKWSKMDESTGVPSLSKLNIQNIIVTIPQIVEQITIGNFFRNLDEQLMAQQKKLSQLKQLKSAYLQKMFI